LIRTTAAAAVALAALAVAPSAPAAGGVLAALPGPGGCVLDVEGGGGSVGTCSPANALSDGSGIALAPDGRNL
jgi:hypothetical protein